MKKIFVFILLFISFTVFSQNDSLKYEVLISYKYNRFNISSNGKLEYLNNYDLATRFFSIETKYHKDYSVFAVGLEYMVKNDFYKFFNYDNEHYIAQHIYIPLSYSIYFNRNRIVNPVIGISLVNNIVFNERIVFRYSIPIGGAFTGYETYEESNEIDIRYQMKVTLDFGLNIKIKKRHILYFGFNQFLFGDFKLNPGGEETLPYKSSSVFMGLGYKF